MKAIFSRAEGTVFLLLEAKELQKEADAGSLKVDFH